MGSNQKKEEAFAYAAREFIRSAAIGQKVEFKIEYELNGREQGILFVDSKNFNAELVRAGLAKVYERKGKSSLVSECYDELLEL